MNQIRTVFFGTHNFAASILQTLIDDPLFDIRLVITQPDKPVGRTKKMQESAVKQLAMEHSIEIEQPQSLKGYKLDKDVFDIGITAQYGLLIPEHILNSPKKGIINVHTSLLPKYRGASPIQSALINGDNETGVSIMLMDKGLDTGPIIAQDRITIDEHDTYIQLENKLAQIANMALPGVVNRFIQGQLIPVDQDHTIASTCSQFDRDCGRIDWNNSSAAIYNKFRGLTPWPGLWTTWNQKRLKLLEIRPAQTHAEPGQVIIENGKMYIGCSDNCVEAVSVQLEGKSPMDTKSFLNGFHHINQAKLV